MQPTFLSSMVYLGFEHVQSPEGPALNSLVCPTNTVLLFVDS